MARALAVLAAVVMLAVPAAAAADTVKIDFETPPPAPPVWQSDEIGLGSVVNGEYLTSAFAGFLATYRARDTTRVSAPMTCSIVRPLRRQPTGGRPQRYPSTAAGAGRSSLSRPASPRVLVGQDATSAESRRGEAFHCEAAVDSPAARLP
jgi:hypothetical protein